MRGGGVCYLIDATIHANVAYSEAKIVPCSLNAGNMHLRICVKGEGTSIFFKLLTSVLKSSLVWGKIAFPLLVNQL